SPAEAAGKLQIAAGERQGSAMAAPNTYAVHLSSETHKIEAWCESDEALAKQLQEEEDSLATREFAGSVSLEPSSPAVEYRPANNAAQVWRPKIMSTRIICHMSNYKQSVKK
uniref:Uncharacterized protein n=1 Tax=Aegilops tauschii subsp. strangulata TaxID=200361 RepID=A0A453LDG1_AEGTS